MFTKDILFGMNILTLAGFIVMGLSLTLQRMAAAGRPFSIGLMCAGTALVLLELFAGNRPRRRHPPPHDPPLQPKGRCLGSPQGPTRFSSSDAPQESRRLLRGS
jgi:hypothetical protein